MSVYPRGSGDQDVCLFSYLSTAGTSTGGYLSWRKFSTRLARPSRRWSISLLNTRSSEEHNEVDRTELCKLLRSFSNVKTVRIDNGLVEELFRSLQLDDDDGDLPLELLPELQELTYSGSGDNSTTGDPFTPLTLRDFWVAWHADREQRE